MIAINGVSLDTQKAYCNGKKLFSSAANGKMVYKAPYDPLVDPVHLTNTFGDLIPDESKMEWKIYGSGTLGNTSNKYFGAVCAGNDKVVLLPYTSPQFALIRPSTGNITLFGTANSALAKYRGGVYCGNGKVLAIPGSGGSQYAMIDTNPATPTVTYFGDTTLDSGGFWGGAYVGNNTVIPSKSGNTRFRKVNTSNNTASNFTSAYDGPTTPSWFATNFYLGNGMVVPVVESASGTGYVMDTDAIATRLEDFGGAGWRGGVFLGGAEVLAIPYSSDRRRFQIFNFSTRTTRTLGAEDLPVSSNRYSGGVIVSASRHVLAIPYCVSYFTLVDVNANTTTEITPSSNWNISGADRYIGAAYAGNGYIVAAPYYASSVMVVKLGPGYPDISEEALLSSYFNKF